MFLGSSRYNQQKTVEAVMKDGRRVKAVTIRRLPAIDGSPVIVKGNDRLDIMALLQYNEPTKAWHIADANSELEAGALVKETGRVIKVPEK